MPIIHGKSKKAFEKNLKTEMAHGKSKDQSLAIAYSVQRQARKKKYAHGGHVHDDVCMNKGGMCYNNGGEVEPKRMTLGERIGYPGFPKSGDRSSVIGPDSKNDRERKKMMAHGGMIDEEDYQNDMVDLDENSMEYQPHNFDEMNHDALMKELYDDEQLSMQPTDSNQHGREIESDVHDMIDRIRRKLKQKRGF